MIAHAEPAALDRLKARIQGLHSKTRDNGCTEAEALSAAAKVAELLDRYDLSLTDVEIRDAECEQREYETFRKKRIPLDGCIGAIANFCDCRVWREKNQAGETRYVFFGLRSDIEVADYLTEVIDNAVRSELGRYKMSAGYRRFRHQDRHMANSSFTLAMVASIADKLKVMKRERDAVNNGTGRDLVVLKASVVEMDACCVKISQLYIANSCNQLLIEESSLDQLSTSLQLSRKMVLIELGVERLWPKLRKARQLRFSIGGATMNDAGTLPQHMLYIRELTAEAFAPYGQIIAPLRTGGQGAETSYDPETSTREAKLVLGNGEPRLWIMHLPHVGLGFTRIARHRRVTQCLGSLGGKEWLIGVAPPGDLGDDARPRHEDIAAFRIPGDRLIKLHAATWHAGPHFTHDECLFVNLENLDTNRRDFHAVPLGVECRYRL